MTTTKNKHYLVDNVVQNPIFNRIHETKCKNHVCFFQLYSKSKKDNDDDDDEEVETTKIEHTNTYHLQSYQTFKNQRSYHSPIHKIERKREHNIHWISILPNITLMLMPDRIVYKVV